ncbi:molecular chaperone HtpG [Tissierella creatinophila]|uniref:Chaperone protein HtpG n=1 Tax=Tissierella creatinophila DSM 6911 TaxID=1123403 RepID=A0A1U7M8T0_TISCR|nr:molecular chaperone HtpG [Tissierella creatinophila]OLS03685.1 chaperone protein HtpG [Tissierella creatinophila DSM 6911]
MEKREFKAESKRLLDLMINSIYTNKEIFLRELISNASDAIDKYYYKALTDSDINFNKEDFFINISIDKENRELTIKDTGIGMTREELEDNLGIIARSGSFNFKNENDKKEDIDIIGQFGVGFYSAFMVSDSVKVKTKALGENEAFLWKSSGAEGYTIESTTKEKIGTEIVLKIKESTEDEDYDEFLDEYTIKALIKRYSDFIRYPIKMMITKQRQNDDSKEYEEYKELEIINSMVPIWRKNKNELDEQDYENFYREKHFGMDKPLKTIHFNVDGMVSYRSILFIPSNTPYDFYTKEYEKGLELYSSGVLIMEKCSELIPDYFSFVKGVIDSEDLSLNISREMLQNNRELKLIAKKIEEKIKDELKSLLENEREKYKEFFKNFGKGIKFGVYNDFGMNKEKLQDLLMFYSSKEKDLVTLDEYVEKMKEDQKYIYYASGDSIDRLDKLPQSEIIKDKDYEILYLTEDVDEFAIKILISYKDKEFRSVSSEDLGIEEDKEKKKEEEKTNEANKDLFLSMKEILGDKINEVKSSKRLKNYPVCLSSDGDISIEMEKILSSMSEDSSIKASKTLEINVNHDIFNTLQKVYSDDKDKFILYTNLLYDQALLIEGLPIEDPIEFSKNISKLM